MSEESLNEYYRYIKRVKGKGGLGNNIYVSEAKFQQIMGVTQPRYFGNRGLRQLGGN